MWTGRRPKHIMVCLLLRPGVMNKEHYDWKYIMSVVPIYNSLEFWSGSATFWFWVLKIIIYDIWSCVKQYIIRKHCQRHNGPKGWVYITRSQCTVHKTWTYYNVIISIIKALTSKPKPNISTSTKSKVKILTIPSFRILTKIQLLTSTKHQQQNTDQTSASKSRLNFDFKILTKPCVW